MYPIRTTIRPQRDVKPTLHCVVLRTHFGGDIFNGEPMKLPEMKPIPDFPGYFASADGRVWSNKSGKTLQLKGTPSGKVLYNQYGFTINGRRVNKRGGWCILSAFVGPRPKGLFACHGPNGSLDDSLANLYWATPKQNELDKVRDKTVSNGERHWNHKLTKRAVLQIRSNFAKGQSLQQLGRDNGVCYQTISAIIKGTTWRHI